MPNWLSRLINTDLELEHGHIKEVVETEAHIKRHWLRRWLDIAMLPILLVIALGWILAFSFLSKVRLDNSIITTRQSDTVLGQIIQDQVAKYRLHLTYPDNSTKSFSPGTMGIWVDSVASVNNIRTQQHQFSQRIQWWHPITANLVLKVNNSTLYQFIATQATQIIQPAKDANLSIVKGKVQLTDAVSGKHYGLTSPYSTILTAVNRLQSQPLKMETLDTKPPILSSQLAPYQTQLQNILSQKISFDFTSKKVTASPTDIANWVEISTVNNGRKIDITVNSGKVLSYINQITSNQVHPPKAQVEVTQSDGSAKIIVPGVNGTAITNQVAIASDVTQSLLQGKNISETLAIQYASFKTVAAKDYPKWIEVDLTNKRMYAYEQSNLVRTFLISAGAPKTPTVTGQYAIYSKFVQQDMHGSNTDGSSYFVPKVPWVNYFYKDYAIHGNYWRPLSYFGNINSSHGCVGIQVGDGEWMYSWAPIGTPVIIHT